MAGKYKVLPVGAQRFDVHVVTYSQLDKLERALKKAGVPADVVTQDMEDARNAVEDGGALCYFNGIAAMILSDEYSEVLVWHESLHIVSRVWKESGRPLSLPEDDEILAYGQQDLVERVKREIYGITTPFFERK